MTIQPFEIHIDEAQLVDLRTRLAATRWPGEIPGVGWDYGVPVEYMRSLVDYWQHSYDWRRAESLLNSFPQFTTTIDGVDIHFIHRRSPRPDAIPLLMTHGWPGSVVEFHKVIEPLADPDSHGAPDAKAFDVICPSLPGYGFSSQPQERGWGIPRTAAAWAVLIDRLGYSKYVAQGGDWGSIVSTNIGQTDPHCVGIHLNIVMAFPPDPLPDDLTDGEIDAIAALQEYTANGSAYANQQRTRPQTLAFGLTDSPVGQAAWIIDKFYLWSDCNGDLDSTFTRDELLDNVMLYWLTGTNASAARLYYESMSDTVTMFNPVPVPTACANFPKEIMRSSRRWADARYGNITQWTEYDAGGHFAAMEQPESFVDDVRRFGALLSPSFAGSADEHA